MLATQRCRHCGQRFHVSDGRVLNDTPDHVWPLTSTSQCPGVGTFLLRSNELGKYGKDADKVPPIVLPDKFDANVRDLVGFYIQRAEHGLKKYGVTTQRTDLTIRDWLQHTLEEQMDQTVYLKRVISDLDKAVESGKGLIVDDRPMMHVLRLYQAIVNLETDSTGSPLPDYVISAKNSARDYLECMKVLEQRGDTVTQG